MRVCVLCYRVYDESKMNKTKSPAGEIYSCEKCQFPLELMDLGAFLQNVTFEDITGIHDSWKLAKTATGDEVALRIDSLISTYYV